MVCSASTTFAAHCLTALPHPNLYSTRVVASTKMLPKTREAATWGEASARWRDGNLWQRSGTDIGDHPRRAKGEFPDALTATTGLHRKGGSRLLRGAARNQGKLVVGRFIYDEAVREASCWSGGFRPQLR